MGKVTTYIMVTFLISITALLLFLGFQLWSTIIVSPTIVHIGLGILGSINILAVIFINCYLIFTLFK